MSGLQALPLGAARLRSLGPREASGRWFRALVEANALRVKGGEPGSPPALLARLYALAEELAQLEREIGLNRNPLRITLAAPRRWWLFLPLLYVFSLLLAFSRESFEDRLLTFAGSWAIYAALAVGVVAWVLAVNIQVRRQRARVAEGGVALREQVWSELLSSRDQLLSRPFVLQHEGRLLVHCPDLAWLEEELLLHPQREDLKAAHEQLCATLDAYLESPPELWAEAGLRALGTARSGPPG